MIDLLAGVFCSLTALYALFNDQVLIFFIMITIGAINFWVFNDHRGSSND